MFCRSHNTQQLMICVEFIKKSPISRRSSRKEKRPIFRRSSKTKEKAPYPAVFSKKEKPFSQP